MNRRVVRIWTVLTVLLLVASALTGAALLWFSIGPSYQLGRLHLSLLSQSNEWSHIQIDGSSPQEYYDQLTADTTRAADAMFLHGICFAITFLCALITIGGLYSELKKAQQEVGPVSSETAVLDEPST